MFYISKKAIGMIELIISMVVISIILLAIPRLILESTKATGVILQQESISIIMSHTLNILNKYWDQNIVGLAINAPILEIGEPRITTPTNSNDFIFNSFHQEGVPNDKKYLSSRRFKIKGELIFYKASNITHFGKNFDGDAVLYNDIDDYNNSIESLSNSNYNNAGEFIDQNVRIHTTVTYASDFAKFRTNSKLEVNNIFNDRDLSIYSYNSTLFDTSAIKDIEEVIDQLRLINPTSTMTIIDNLNKIIIKLNGDYTFIKKNEILNNIAIIQQRIVVLMNSDISNRLIYINIGNIKMENIRNKIDASTKKITYQSNIKFIKTVITSNNPDEVLKKNIALYSFSCNIGSYYPEGQLYVTR